MQIGVIKGVIRLSVSLLPEINSSGVVGKPNHAPFKGGLSSKI